MRTNYVKVLRELKTHKGRSFAAMIGILIGVACIGFVLSAYSILTREMNANFMSTNPASVVMKVTNLDEKAIQLIEESNANIDIEVRKTMQARIDRGNGTYGTIYLFAVEDFDRLKVDTFTMEKGRFPESKTEMSLERASLGNLMNLAKGYDESVRVKLPGGEEKDIFLSGLVHAPGLAPASMEKYSYGFLTLECLRELGYQGWYDEIHLVSYDNRFDKEAMKTWAKDLEGTLHSNGYTVEKVSVPEPGKHPHGDQLKSLLFLLQAFAAISFIVASVIIINLMNFIMSRQTRQIAIMKAVGASTRDIALPYFLYVLLLSAGAIAVGIPTAIFIGTAYSDFAADVLNFKIMSYAIPFQVFAVQIAVGILMPLAASFYPIYRSCRISVKEGLSEKIDNEKMTRKGISRHRKTTNRINTQILIPLNNSLRKKGRTILAIIALAAGGVLFMTAQNIVASIEKTVDKSMNMFGYNYEVRLFGQYTDDSIMNALDKIEGIEKAEIYDTNTAAFVMDDGMDSGNYLIRALPKNSELVRFDLVSGSLSTGSTSSVSSTSSVGSTSSVSSTPYVIINQGLLDSEKWIQPGMTVIMEIQGIREEVIVAGIVNEVPPMPCIYMNKDTFEDLYGSSNRQNIIISTKNLALNEQLTLSKEIESVFKAQGIEIGENWNIGLYRKAFIDHLKIIIDFLSVVALLAVFVGGLSISSAIGISTSERRRELGILRAIGANARQTIFMISMEGVLMGGAGWLLGLVLAYPISIRIGNYFGQIMLHSDLSYASSVSGALIWLAISLGASLLSGLVPARKTAYAPLREMLAYE